MQKNKISEYEERLRKLDEIKQAGFKPYPARSEKTHSIGMVLSEFNNLEKKKKSIVLCGRLISKRSHGNLSFGHLCDGESQIQVAFSKQEVGPEKYKFFTKLIDIGDFLEIHGECFLTHKGEQSVMLKDFKLLSKALRPLPDKWHGLKDEEEKYRKRYLDLLSNTELRAVFKRKAKFWEVTRRFMKDKGFLEVETPTLETTTGGAEANPFCTHHDDYDIDLYLRISVGELWQKRLMAAGFSKTFEIGRIYRNEGSSPEHLQEFTNMEFYWAYADYNDGMKLTQELYQTIANEVFNTTKFKTKDHVYDLAGNWPKLDYREEIISQTGIDVLKAKESEMIKKLDKLNIKYEGDNRERLTDTLWKYCRKKISGPVFLVNHPRLISPLAKAKDDNPELTERFQILIAGAEVGNGYSELNNPLDQKKRFEEQRALLEAGDTEAMMPDMEFVEMLEYGMPPTCGFGFGERLFSFMVDKTVRETTLFPLIRPKERDANTQQNLQQTQQTPFLGIDYKGAQGLVSKYIKNDITRMHLLESEAIMRALAEFWGEDADKWGIIGLLHDIDWDLTKEDLENHTLKCVKILKEAGASDFLIETIVSHGYGLDLIPANKDKARSGRIQHALVSAETLTGLIIASALIRPDRKLANVKLNSLKKKFKQKAFAANCNRNLIREIEKTGMALEEFLEIGLKALQNISTKLGL